MTAPIEAEPTKAEQRQLLLTEIAALEVEGRFAAAASLKTRLSHLATKPEEDPERDARIGELHRQIAGLEAHGEFAAAAPLKTQLSHLVSR